MSYDFYKSRASQLGTTITQIEPNTFDQSQITKSGVYEAPGDLTINLYSHVNGRRVVLLVDGNVTINSPITILRIKEYLSLLQKEISPLPKQSESPITLTMYWQLPTHIALTGIIQRKGV